MLSHFVREKQIFNYYSNSKKRRKRKRNVSYMSEESKVIYLINFYKLNLLSNE